MATVQIVSRMLGRKLMKSVVCTTCKILTTPSEFYYAEDPVLQQVKATHEEWHATLEPEVKLADFFIDWRNETLRHEACYDSIDFDSYEGLQGLVNAAKSHKCESLVIKV